MNVEHQQYMPTFACQVYIFPSKHLYKEIWTKRTNCMSSVTESRILLSPHRLTTSRWWSMTWEEYVPFKVVPFQYIMKMICSSEKKQQLTWEHIPVSVVFNNQKNKNGRRSDKFFGKIEINKISSAKLVCICPLNLHGL